VPFGTTDRSRDGGADEPIKIGTAMLLLPLHRPVRVAEDVAVLDNIANGRFILGVAAGYRPIEFEGLGEARRGREARMEEQLDILIKSWTTDSFAYSGTHYQLCAQLAEHKCTC
jgi:alkanesulfonate monooxygenase SsuD/methylene tetrahydromethanopterin reductase-like flavin-dependent oxidoreductase (luciferase family)